MKPIDLRNATWETIRASLQGRLLAVFQVWQAHGPGTTRQVALRSGYDILSLRPRTTDLYQCGLIELAGRNGDEGIYRARSKADWEVWADAERPPVEQQTTFSGYH